MSSPDELIQPGQSPGAEFTHYPRSAALWAGAARTRLFDHKFDHKSARTPTRTGGERLPAWVYVVSGEWAASTGGGIRGITPTQGSMNVSPVDRAWCPPSRQPRVRRHPPSPG